VDEWVESAVHLWESVLIDYSCGFADLEILMCPDVCMYVSALIRYLPWVSADIYGYMYMGVYTGYRNFLTR
jgi:hypothetical protein